MVEAVTVFIKVILHADHVILFLHPNKIIRVERPNHDRISHREKTGKGSGGLVVIRLAPIRKTRQKSPVDGAASPPPAGGREEGRKDGDENSPVYASAKLFSWSPMKALATGRYYIQPWNTVNAMPAVVENQINNSSCTA